MDKNYSKKDLNKIISNKTGLAESIIKKFNDILIDNFKKVLIKNKKIIIKNFGSFNHSRKSSRIGRNPKTKTSYQILERTVIRFSPSKKLILKINND